MGENVQHLSIEELKEQAAAAGLEDDFYFRSTFERYQTQLYVLSELRKTIMEEGMLVTKEYVKGRGNVYTNPAVTEYNRTADSANKTVATLIRIIKSFGNEDKADETDPLLAALSGAATMSGDDE